MDDLEESFAEMSLYSISDLDELVSSMKSTSLETFTLADIVDRLKQLKVEKSVKGDFSGKEPKPVSFQFKVGGSKAASPLKSPHTAFGNGETDQTSQNAVSEKGLDGSVKELDARFDPKSFYFGIENIEVQPNTGAVRKGGGSKPIRTSNAAGSPTKSGLGGPVSQSKNGNMSSGEGGSNGSSSQTSTGASVASSSSNGGWFWGTTNETATATATAEEIGKKHDESESNNNMGSAAGIPIPPTAPPIQTRRTPGDSNSGGIHHIDSSSSATTPMTPASEYMMELDEDTPGGRSNNSSTGATATGTSSGAATIDLDMSFDPSVVDSAFLPKTPYTNSNHLGSSSGGVGIDHSTQSIPMFSLGRGTTATTATRRRPKPSSPVFGKKKDTKVTPASFASKTAAPIIVPDLPSTSADVPPAWWGNGNTSTFTTQTSNSNAYTSSTNTTGASSRGGPFSFSAPSAASVPAVAVTGGNSATGAMKKSSVADLSRSIFHDEIFGDAATARTGSGVSNSSSAAASAATASAATAATNGGGVKVTGRTAAETDEIDRSAFMSGFEDDDDEDNDVRDDDTNSVSGMNDISDDDIDHDNDNSSFKNAFRNVDLFGTKRESKEKRGSRKGKQQQGEAEEDSDDDSFTGSDVVGDVEMDEVDPLANMFSPKGSSSSSDKAKQGAGAPSPDKKSKKDTGGGLFDKPFEMPQPPVPPVNRTTSSVPPPVFTVPNASFSPGSSGDFSSSSSKIPSTSSNSNSSNSNYNETNKSGPGSSAFSFIFGIGTAKTAAAAAQKPSPLPSGPPPPATAAAGHQPSSTSSGPMPSASAFSGFKFGPGSSSSVPASSSSSSWTPLFGPTAATLAQRLARQQQQQGTSKPGEASSSSSSKQQQGMSQQSGDPAGEGGGPPSSKANSSKGIRTDKKQAVGGGGDGAAADVRAEERMAQLAELYRKQGAELYSREDYDKALDAFDKSLNFAPKAWPSKGTVLGNRGATLMMLRRYVEAADDCANALLADPTLIKLHCRRGRALMMLGHFTAADEAFVRALELPPSTPSRRSKTSSQERDTELENVKTEARTRLRSLTTCRASLKRLGQLENTADFKEVIKVADELLQNCPMFAVVHASRCAALIQLQRWDECKSAVEEFVCGSHESIQRMNAHPKAKLPAPEADRLVWTEKPGSNTVTVSVASIVQAILCMGPSLGHSYLNSLKNVDASRNCCADVMSRIAAILSDLSGLLTDSYRDGSNAAAAATGASWAWVATEMSRTRSMIDAKNKGDRSFRNSQHADAIKAYSEAIKSDPQAVRWQAILYNNRAASHMSLGNFSEAVSDCHQALNRDSEYNRAYLRRARAHASLQSFAASIRDYRRYLSSDSTPVDYVQVNAELHDVMESKADQAKAETQRQFNDRQRQSSSSSSSSAFPPPPPFPPNGSTTGAGASGQQRGTYTGYGGAAGAGPSSSAKTGYGAYGKYQGAGPNAGGAAGAGAAGNGRRPPSSSSQWTDDDHEKFEYYKFFGSRGGAGGRGPGANKSAPPPPPPPRFGGGSKPTESSDSEDDDGFSTGGEQCHYKVLGVEATSTEREIKTAYRQLALKFHPDKNRDPGAEDRFKTITHSYSVLSDKTQRTQYDRTRPVRTSFRW